MLSMTASNDYSAFSSRNVSRPRFAIASFIPLEAIRSLTNSEQIMKFERFIEYRQVGIQTSARPGR